MAEVKEEEIQWLRVEYKDEEYDELDDFGRLFLLLDFLIGKKGLVLDELKDVKLTLEWKEKEEKK